MKLAIVHDDLIQEGGAEKVVEAMLEIWPQADVFTSMASRRWLSKFERVQTSFMQNLPFKEKLYRHYLAFYPLAFESFDFSNYDVVISSSARFAHGVITSPRTLHVCYIHSVPRMWWGSSSYFAGGWLQSLFSPLASYLRIWDWTAAQRVDCFVANSKHTATRVKKFYRREAEVIYPFVDLERFQLAPTARTKRNGVPPRRGGAGSYFLVVSRLVRWKRIDLVIEACLRVGASLKIIGEGPDMARLKKLAAHSTVEFLGRLSDADVISYMGGARALLFPQCEDLGMALLEALATGTPVLAFKGGGALETMIPGETGDFFYPQTAEALARELTSFKLRRYDPSSCRRRAHQFSKVSFLRKFESFVAAQYATLRAN
ncbi:glycosyltransferase [Candidatus Parcubacteria bacterium]|nr:glycosyltransferase [Candidatus Parcubacteria bacterium]